MNMDAFLQAHRYKVLFGAAVTALVCAGANLIFIPLYLVTGVVLDRKRNRNASLDH